MNRCVVLDAGALSALAGRPRRRSLEVRAALRAAARLQREVVVPSVILADVSYRWRSFSGGRNALVSVYPKVSGSPEPGLIADIRVDELARQLDLPQADLRGALPVTRIQSYQMAGLGLYAEGYAFRSREEIDRFLAKLKGAAISSELAGPPELTS